MKKIVELPFSFAYQIAYQGKTKFWVISNSNTGDDCYFEQGAHILFTFDLSAIKDEIKDREFVILYPMERFITKAYAIIMPSIVPVSLLKESKYKAKLNAYFTSQSVWHKSDPVVACWA